MRFFLDHSPIGIAHMILDSTYLYLIRSPQSFEWPAPRNSRLCRIISLQCLRCSANSSNLSSTMFCSPENTEASVIFNAIHLILPEIFCFRQPFEDILNCSFLFISFFFGLLWPIATLNSHHILLGISYSTEYWPWEIRALYSQMTKISSKKHMVITWDQMNRRPF